MIQQTRRSFSVPDFDPNADYYKVLGVSPHASEREIKASYYKLAQEYHPDKTGGKTEAKFKEISVAYDVLGDAQKKRQYDDMRLYRKPPSSNESPFS